MSDHDSYSDFFLWGSPPVSLRGPPGFLFCRFRSSIN
jgi:hypothetical protein